MNAYGQITLSQIADGKGLVDSIPYYLASPKAEGVLSTDPGWSRTVPELDAENRYLWVYYVSRYGEGETEPERITVTGDPATFTYSGDPAPADSIKVKIKPLQYGAGDPSPDNYRPIYGWNKINIWSASSAPKHYGAVWDRNSAQMTRTGDAAGITTNLTNFFHKGSINANYNNPFDKIYPWSDCKLCNIDIPTYRSLLGTSKSIKECVVAWEGEAGFSYTHQYGVWKYRPPFWGASWDDESGKRHFDITDKPNGAYVYYPEEIIGRWVGVATTLTIDGSSKTCLLPKPGMPCKRTALSTVHTYAKNWNATLDTVFTLDGSTLMLIIECAHTNAQASIGNGTVSLYRESSDQFSVASTGTVVKVVKANASATCRVGAIMDIGTSNGGNQVGSYYIMAVTTDASDSTILNVTLNTSVTVTTSNYWSIHGKINEADSSIGSKSGYIGTDGYVDCYYRGEVLWGNMWKYVLGAYHQANTNCVWIAKNATEADDYDAINTTNHINTGVVLASTDAFIKTLGYPKTFCQLACPSFCTGTGGSSTAPVGDYLYTTTASNTVLIAGGAAGSGTHAGPFYWGWARTASSSSWPYAARPYLKHPLGEDS